MNGFLNVFKEAGYTSNDCVQKLRGILGFKKIGHGGTLDPAVTGVLPVALGKSTRLLEYMDGSGKEYVGEMIIGISTETEDGEGKIVDQKPVALDLSPDLIDQAMTDFLGKVDQVPPMYSAVKVGGKKLYEYARSGKSVARPVRQVEIFSFNRTSPLQFLDQTVRFSFRVACGKGTYIRTLAVDLAGKLGYPGHMARLERTMANGLLIDEAKTLDQIHSLKVADRLEEILQGPELAVAGLAKIDLSQQEFFDIRVGKMVDRQLPVGTVAAFFQGTLVSICQSLGGKVKPHKNLI